MIEDGSLLVGERIVGQGHANLAEGSDVLAAGQVQVSGGRVVQIDNASGHYLPTGSEARQAAIDAFREHGFDAPIEVYLEKVWNSTSNRWEPIHASNP